jgi:NAD(P)-dependent dehydrogenase (short-subunit alcohol dehydrogenase family)
MIKSVVPRMPSGGRIVNISSIVSKTGMGSMPMYSSTKAALDSLTYVWAQEVSFFRLESSHKVVNTLRKFGKSHGITVNSIAPGPVFTDQTIDLKPLEAIKPILLGMTRAADRYGTTGDVADATLLLVSEKARWITGQFISVSGGITGG